MKNVTTGGESEIYNGRSVPTVTSHKVSGLTAGHLYQFYVTGINRVGEGDPSPTSTAIRASQIPSAPAALTYVDSTSTTIDFEVTPATDNGGDTIIRYHIYGDDGNLATELADFDEVTSYLGTTMSFTLDNTVETTFVTGGKYRFYVTVENSLGESEPSNTIRVALGELPS